MKRSLHFAAASLLCLQAAAQSPSSYNIALAPGLHLPKDTVASSLLLQSLQGFLSQKEQANAQNTYVWQPELPATSVLLDEMKGIEQNQEQKQEDFYKACLSNVVPLPDSSYLLQLSYSGIQDGHAVLKAAFRLLARREQDRFVFYTPLRRNSKGWKKLERGHVVFHFRDTIDKNKAQEYQRYNDAYLAKLGNKENQTHLYCCSDMTEGLQLLGVDYQKDYNGRNAGSLSSTQQHTTVVVNGVPGSLQHFDPHDMWHEKLRTVLSGEVINRPVDEGCAYLYGGSWGYSWEDIKAMFKDYRKQHPEADWIALYRSGARFRDGDKYMLVSYFLNALLVQQLEKEKGFPAVMTLLACGKKEKDDANYFRTLEQVAGITQSGFNAHIDKLLETL